LWGKGELLNEMPPFLTGGNMIAQVGVQGSRWAPLPHKFEAGTPPIAQIIGLGAALAFFKTLDHAALKKQQLLLATDAFDFLKRKDHVRLLGQPDEDWVGIVSFMHGKIHPHDLAAFQDAKGVCVRAGHHCAEPLMDYLQVGATIRISPLGYNAKQDIDAFKEAFEDAETMFQ
jgi:selenocysteine lyase/cysteine desulfurase